MAQVTPASRKHPRPPTSRGKWSPSLLSPVPVQDHIPDKETTLLCGRDTPNGQRAAVETLVLISLCLKAAFDTVNHLPPFSLPAVLSWFSSWILPIGAFMQGQSGIARSVFSPLPPLKWDPQWSVLRRLLFFTYVTFFSFHCYADDTQLYLSFPGWSLRLSQDLKQPLCLSQEVFCAKIGWYTCQSSRSSLSVQGWKVTLDGPFHGGSGYSSFLQPFKVVKLGRDK